MNFLSLGANGQRRITFEDLMGLRAEGYVRDSTLDQRDGYGPELQRRAIQTFAESYGLIFGETMVHRLHHGHIHSEALRLPEGHR